MLDRNKHEMLLKRILREMYENSALQASLAFKGGTCLYLFFDLERFSTDLDFDLISDSFEPGQVDRIVRNHLEVKSFEEKRYTWFWLASHTRGKQKIKVEINKRQYPNHYTSKDYYGLKMPILAPDSMFAHKLCAITDRKKIQNRDLYDAWFMFKHDFDVHEEIVELRTNKNVEQYFKELIDFIEGSVFPTTILNGLGEVLDAKQKAWAKANLIDELLFELKIRANQ